MLYEAEGPTRTATLDRTTIGLTVQEPPQESREPLEDFEMEDVSPEYRY